ncbi:MAG: hypothetical protein WCA12_19560, partial [Burkholderiales bacterium]
MHPIAVPIGRTAASPAAVLATGAVAIAAALAAALPLVDLLPCVTLWLHGVAACLRCAPHTNPRPISSKEERPMADTKTASAHDEE